MKWKRPIKQVNVFISKYGADNKGKSLSVKTFLKTFFGKKIQKAFLRKWTQTAQFKLCMVRGSGVPDGLELFGKRKEQHRTSHFWKSVGKKGNKEPWLWAILNVPLQLILGLYFPFHFVLIWQVASPRLKFGALMALKPIYKTWVVC